jgi:hypothetical protein
VLPQKVHGFGLAFSTRLVPVHPMIQQTRSWSDSRPRCRSSRRRRRKLLHPRPRLCRMHPGDGRLADKGRVPFGSYTASVIKVEPGAIRARFQTTPAVWFAPFSR